MKISQWVLKLVKVPKNIKTKIKSKNYHKKFNKSYGNKKFLNIHRKTPVLESVSYKVSLKERLKHKCSPVNIAKFLRTLFWKASVNGCFIYYILLYHLFYFLYFL